MFGSFWAQKSHLTRWELLSAVERGTLTVVRRDHTSQFFEKSLREQRLFALFG
jgi:hypothetical protein